MKQLFTLLFVLLTTSVLATPSRTTNEQTRVKRDLATITSAINAVNSSAASLDAAVQAYSGGDISAIASAGSDVLAQIQSSTSAVNAQPQLSQGDTISLQPLVQSLSSTVNITIADLIAKKPQFVAAYAAGEIYANLQAQMAASVNFRQAVTSKLPNQLQSLGSQLSAGIITSLQNGINAFSAYGGSSNSSMNGTAPTVPLMTSSPSASASGSGGSSGSSSGAGLGKAPLFGFVFAALGSGALLVFL